MSEGVDPAIHPINRLRICVTLMAAGATEDENGPDREMKFSVLRDFVGLGDVTLSKQLGALESKGYIARHREYGSRRAEDNVWISLTRQGVHALEGHLAALGEIAGMVEGGQG